MKTWIVLKDLSNSRLIYSSSIWIFVVPAVAKFSGEIGGLWVDENIFEFAVPYSFYLLYFSAVAFFLGSVVYLVFCPEIIKKINSYSDFLQEGMTVCNLNESLKKVSEEKSKKLIEVLRKEAGSATPEEIDEFRVLTLSSGQRPITFSFEKEKISVVFWLIYRFHQEQRVAAQTICWLAFSIGIVLVFSILFLNLVYVVRDFF